MWGRINGSAAPEQEQNQPNPFKVVGLGINLVLQSIEELSAQQVDETAPYEEQLAFRARATGLLDLLTWLESAQEKFEQ